MRILLMLIGAGILFCYGLILNIAPLDFGRLIGAVDADQPPLRLVLGATTIAKFRAAYDARLANWSHWEPISNAAHGARHA